MSTKGKTFTREELFEYLEKDGLEIEKAQLNFAKMGVACGFGSIGQAYLDKKEVDKSIAWCRLAAEKDDLKGQLLLARAYKIGEGVPKDVLTSMIYFLKLPNSGESYTMAFIPDLFLDKHKSGSVDKYKALEWYTRTKDTENIEILNKAGIYLREEDRNKPYIQLKSEAVNYVNEQTVKKNAKNAHPTEQDALNEQMINTLQKKMKELREKNQNSDALKRDDKMKKLFEENRRLVIKLREKDYTIDALHRDMDKLMNMEKESRKLQHSYAHFEQQLKDKEETINSLRSLVQSKDNEIDHLKEINQLQKENQGLKIDLQGNQNHVQPSIPPTEHTSSSNNNNADHHLQQCSRNGVNGIIVKTEPEVENKEMLLSTIGNKKRKVASNES